MPIDRPTLQTLIDRIEGDIEGGIDATAPLLQNSVLKVLARVLAGSCHLNWGYLIWIAQQVMPDQAEAAYLERWSNIYGIFRIPATYAVGTVQASGTNGTTLPEGTVLVSAGGIEYTSSADETIALGVATLTITATTPGSVGSLANGQVLNLLQPVAGVSSQAVVQAGGLIAGDDAETDPALRSRLLARIQNPPQGGSKSDYLQWMLACPTVDAAACWVYPEYEGAGTVGITFSMGRDDPIPTDPEVAAMLAFVEVLAPVTARVIAFAPTLVTQAMTIHISPSTDALKAAVTASLADFFTNSGAPGSTLYLSQINEAIASVPGIVDHTLTVPAANIVLTDSQIATLGAITWT